MIRRVVEIYGGLSRTELASTVCELLGWERPNGGLKTIECRQFLESLQERSVIELPAPRVGRRRGSRTAVVESAEGEAREPLVGSLRDVTPRWPSSGWKPMPIGPCGGSWWSAITTWVIGCPSAPIFAT